MAELKLKPVAPKKDDFIANAGRRTKTITIRRSPRVASSVENEAIKMMFFGPWGTGKTRTIKDLLELGYKVYALNTDLGGSGTLTVKVELRNEGKAHLLDNLIELDLE